MIAYRYRSVDGQIFIERLFRTIYSKEINNEYNHEMNSKSNYKSNYESKSESNHELNCELKSELNHKSNHELKRVYSSHTILRGEKMKDSGTVNCLNKKI